MGCIGNLTPLAADVNNAIPEGSTLEQKVKYYKKSSLQTVKILTADIEKRGIKKWSDKEINSRTAAIGKNLYHTIMKIEKI